MPQTGHRLAKCIAQAGLCSRREAERWIEAGRVAVNGQKILTPACNIFEADTVTVDGKPLPAASAARLWLYHKPAGLVTTHKDPQGRSTVFDALPEDLPRVISVGRLDLNSEGLLLLTNDGELARKLELPSSGWLRSYRVRVHGAISEGMLEAIRKGVCVDGVQYAPAEIEMEAGKGSNRWLTMTLSEGKNREIRNIFTHFDCRVSRLIRTAYGPYRLGELPRGEVTEADIRKLQEETHA